MSEKKVPMTHEAASRIQSHADRTGNNQDFKERAQRAAEKNRDVGGGPGGASDGGQPKKK